MPSPAICQDRPSLGLMTPEESAREQTLGGFYAFAAYFLWGFMPLYFILLAPIGPWEIVVWRILFSLLFCAVLLTVTRTWPKLLAILRELARSGEKPPRDIVWAFFADEEAGGLQGSGYVVAEHPELFEGCTEAIRRTAQTLGRIRSSLDMAAILSVWQARFRLPFE